jgi:hypothetical protein
MATNGTTNHPPLSSTPPPLERPARLSLNSTRSQLGMLDGAWWPRSRDAEVELPILITALTQLTGPVYRIALNRSLWTTHPRRLTVAGRIVKLGWYGPSDIHAISVNSQDQRRLDLLVVPPGASEESAAAAMAAACDAAGHVRATALLAQHGIEADAA